jgi:hypothetical protein
VAFCDLANGGCCPPERTCNGICCEVGETCVDGACTGCRSDADCPEGQICDTAAGECRQVGCQQEQCGAGLCCPGDRICCNRVCCAEDISLCGHLRGEKYRTCTGQCDGAQTLCQGPNDFFDTCCAPDEECYFSPAGNVNTCCVSGQGCPGMFPGGAQRVLCCPEGTRCMNPGTEQMHCA